MNEALPALTEAEGILDPNTINRILNLALGVVAVGIDVTMKLKDLDNAVRGMVAAGRDPNEGEWEALLGRSDAAHDRIQGFGREDS